MVSRRKVFKKTEIFDRYVSHRITNRFLTLDKGMEIESSKDFQIAVEGQQHTLTINDPYPEDTGVFLISASNNFGKATSTGM